VSTVTRGHAASLDALPATVDAVAGLRVTVMGLGYIGAGLSMARWFDRHGARVLVTDLATPRYLPRLADLRDVHCSRVLGRHRAEDMVACDLVAASPAVRPNSPYLRLADDAGIPVAIDIELFLRWSPSRNLIGITGTKGKSTTTALVASVLAADGRHVVAVGNNEVPPFDHLDELTAESWVVMELSSQQLERLERSRIKPRVSVLTNLGIDHLMVHGSPDEYARCKRLLFQFQDADDLAIIHHDGARCDEVARICRARTHRHRAEALPADWKLQLPGMHNRANAAAALAVARELGIPDTNARSALADVEPLFGRHRVLGEVNGVLFVDDFFATAGLAIGAALAHLARPTILVTGGGEVGLDPAPIRAQSRWLKGLALMPTDDESNILAAAGDARVERVGDLNSAVHAAYAMAEPGDAVLYVMPFGGLSSRFGNPFVGRGPSGPWSLRFERAFRELQAAGDTK
jgi:UDP-N-acetylmuramoylalanine--D-glutamate ligase